MKAQPITSRIKPNAESNYQSRRRFPRAIAALVLALTILASLSFARSSHAVPMLFTLTGVTFNDGATATGSFALNPTTGNFRQLSLSPPQRQAQILAQLIRLWRAPARFI